jgi:sugar lactone lactonase YvrE
VTSSEFGGAALDVLYITSSAVPVGDANANAIEPRPAGALFACTPGVVGVAARTFGA